jgi:hypothetical protein
VCRNLSRDRGTRLEEPEPIPSPEQACDFTSAPNEPRGMVQVPSQQKRSLTAGDEGQDREDRPNTLPARSEEHSALGEDFDRTNRGLVDGQSVQRYGKYDDIVSSKEDEYDTKVPGTDISDREDEESENEVQTALELGEPAPDECVEENDDENDDDDDNGDDGYLSDEGDYDEGDDADDREEPEATGWKTVSRNKSASPVSRSPIIRPLGGNERYFPKGTPVEEPEGEDPESIIVASASLPAARDAPYDLGRGLEDVAQDHYRLRKKPNSPNRPHFSVEQSRDMLSALNTGTAGQSISRENFTAIPNTLFSSISSYALMGYVWCLDGLCLVP